MHPFVAFVSEKKGKLPEGAQFALMKELVEILGLESHQVTVRHHETNIVIKIRVYNKETLRQKLIDNRELLKEVMEANLLDILEVPEEEVVEILQGCSDRRSKPTIA